MRLGMGYRRANGRLNSGSSDLPGEEPRRWRGHVAQRHLGYYAFFEGGSDIPSYVLTAYYYGDWRKRIAFRKEFSDGSQVKSHVRRVVFGWAEKKNIC